MKNEANVFMPKTPLTLLDLCVSCCVELHLMELTNNINCCEVQSVQDTFAIGAVCILLVCFLALIAFMCVYALHLYSI